MPISEQTAILRDLALRMSGVQGESAAGVTADHAAALQRDRDRSLRAVLVFDEMITASAGPSTAPSTSPDVADRIARSWRTDHVTIHSPLSTTPSPEGSRRTAARSRRSTG
jgi:hypothetical protein